MKGGLRVWYVSWPPLLVVCLLLFLWELGVTLFSIPPYMLPTPWQVGQALVDQPGRLLSATGRTAIAMLLGFVCSAVGGVVLGSCLTLVPLARRGVYPLTLILQMVPLVAIAPMLVVWFGWGIPSVIAAACIVSIFPVIASTLDGLQSVDPGLKELFRIYGAGKMRTWWMLGFPASLPSIFTGLRIAAGLAVIGAIVGEFVGSYGGDHAPLGSVITSALKQTRTDVVFAAIILAAALGFALFGIVNLLGWLFLRRWHSSAR
ncbi:MAG: ABC transporter permease [Mariniblastus sp.]|nr:ABC transporter permease [Mariniblastus sp.]